MSNDSEASIEPEFVGPDDSADDIADAPFGLQVSFPETVTIRMVDASTLGDYEFSFFVAGVCCNFTVGFCVAAITIPEQATVLWIVAAMFSFVTASFVIWAFSKRAVLKRKERVIRVRGGKGRVVG